MSLGGTGGKGFPSTGNSTWKARGGILEAAGWRGGVSCTWGPQRVAVSLHRSLTLRPVEGLYRKDCHACRVGTDGSVRGKGRVAS